MAISIKSRPVLTGKLLQMIPHEIEVAKIEYITNKAKGVMPMQGI